MNRRTRILLGILLGFLIVGIRWASADQIQLGGSLNVTPDYVYVSNGSDTWWFKTATDTVLTAPMYIGNTDGACAVQWKAASASGTPCLRIDYLQSSFLDPATFVVSADGREITEIDSSETYQQAKIWPSRLPWIKLRFIGLSTGSGNATDTGVECAFIRKPGSAGAWNEMSPTTVGDLVLGEGVQIAAEAKDIDGSALPNAVSEGQATTPGATLWGNLLVTAVNEDGSQSLLDSLNAIADSMRVLMEASLDSLHAVIDALGNQAALDSIQNMIYDMWDNANDAQRSLIINWIHTQELGRTVLFDAITLDDSPTADTSAVFNISAFDSRTFFVLVDTVGAGFDSLTVCTRGSYDNTNFYGGYVSYPDHGIPIIEPDGTSTCRAKWTTTCLDSLGSQFELPAWFKYGDMIVTAYGTNANDKAIVTIELDAKGSN